VLIPLVFVLFESVVLLLADIRTLRDLDS